MKKQVLLIFFLIQFLQTDAQLNYGLKVGFNNSNAIYTPNDIAHKSIGGFQFGALGEYKLYRFLFLKSNLLFTQKGNYGDNSTISTTYYQRTTFRLSFIELDILAAFKFKIGKEFSFDIGAGPYLGRGLFGKDKGIEYNAGTIKTINRGVKYSYSFKGSYNGLYFDPYDFGINYSGCIYYKKYLFYTNYGSAINSRVMENAMNRTSKNRVWSIGVGYFFK